MFSSVRKFAKLPRSRFPQAPTNISTRFDLDLNHRPLYSGQNEFSGGPIIYPPIVVDGVTGESRSLEQHDYENAPFTASDTRDSDEVSSVHKVRDLGLGAAADGIPNSVHKSSDGEILKRDAFVALQDYREMHSPIHVELELRQKVDKNLCASAFDQKDYLPIDIFEAIFSVESIIMLLAERYPQATDEELWSKFTSIFDPHLQKSRRRILGILVLMRGFSLLENFIEQNIWDDNLPFKNLESLTRVLPLMKDWDRTDIDLFCIYQQKFFVPFFDIQDQRLLSYDLDRDIRLPWQKFEYKTSGGTGIVHQVEIHPSHHSFRRPGIMTPVFALKEIDVMDHKAYNEELSALEKTCAQVQKEKHLIKLLLTFRHGEKLYLLFEWADGNLENFWESNTIEHPPTSWTERWAAEQCIGLARAVSRIHGLRTWQKKKRSHPTEPLRDNEREWGRHGDIKPENILWFKDYEGDQNLLVISDLGLTRYHTQFSRSLVHRSKIDGCTRAYRPPELDLGHDISQLYDIWSLGCVFLEFCIWYLQGHWKVQYFANERMDDEESSESNMKEDKYFLLNGGFLETGSPELKPSVKKRIVLLREMSTNFTKGLLDVIEDKMLRCDPRDRSPIDKICMDLLHLIDSLPKLNTAEEVSQTSAFAGGEDSGFSQDESSNWTPESLETSIRNEQDTAGTLSKRTERSRPEEIEQENHLHPVAVPKAKILATILEVDQVRLVEHSGSP